MILNSTPPAFVDVKHIVCATYLEIGSNRRIRASIRLDDKNTLEVLYEKKKVVERDFFLIDKEQSS